MRRVFESFVRNLLRRRMPFLKVSARRMYWQQTAGPPRSLEFLPTLNMDIVVAGGSRTLIIDTKFTPKPLSFWYDRPRFRSAHVYQLLTYLRNFALARPGRPVSGLLLYPSTGLELDESLEIHSYPIKVAVLDLSVPWLAIEQKLLGIVRVSTEDSLPQWASSPRRGPPASAPRRSN
jgi:5-methylcytosine-specific restriction enzyme subunit McrC